MIGTAVGFVEKRDTEGWGVEIPELAPDEDVGKEVDGEVDGVEDWARAKDEDKRMVVSTSWKTDASIVEEADIALDGVEEGKGGGEGRVEEPTGDQATQFIHAAHLLPIRLDPFLTSLGIFCFSISAE